LTICKTILLGRLTRRLVLIPVFAELQVEQGFHGQTFHTSKIADMTSFPEQKPQISYSKIHPFIIFKEVFEFVA
jgi:hypothetical protein